MAGLIKDSWYRNAGQPNAVVASVTSLPSVLDPEFPGTPGEAHDWAAYIGPARDKSESREETERHVQKQGCKLPERVARAFFPQLAAVLYRP